MSVYKDILYAYLVGSNRFTFASFEFSKLGSNSFEVCDKNVAEAKLQLEALHAEKDALLKVSLLLLIISNGGKSRHAIGDGSMRTR